MTTVLLCFKGFFAA